MSKKNSILLFFITIFLSIISSPLAGRLYEFIIRRKISSWFWGPSHPEYFEGMIISFLFFGSLLSWIFIKQNKIKYWLFYTLPLLIFLLFLGAFEGLLIGIGSAILGWLLAQGVLLLKKISQKI